MTNMKLLLKRICAYAIDMFTVIIISSLISSIPLLNKNQDNYQKLYKEYEEQYNEYFNYLTLLETAYEDKEITNEEYTQLTESSKYQNLTISKYEDNEISQNEYNEIKEELNNMFNEVAEKYTYLLTKESSSNSIITLVCTLLYFGILQYILKGQTIGKKIMKLKITSGSNKKINIINYILRSLVINNVLLNTISIFFLLLSSRNTYQQANNTINTILSLIQAITIFFLLTREDSRGLHDLLFNTKVILVDEIDKDTNKEPVKTKTNNKKVSKKKNTKVKTIDAEYKEK